MFDFQQIVDGVVEKLVRRHPHVFPQGTLHSRRDPKLPPLTDAEIHQLWANVKAAEKAALNANKDEVPIDTANSSLISQLKPEGTALQQSQHTQKTVAKVGFDWSVIGCHR